MSRDGVLLVTTKRRMIEKAGKHEDGKYVAKGVEKYSEYSGGSKNVTFYFKYGRVPFNGQDDIHFWRPGSLIAAVCPFFTRHWPPQVLAGSILANPARKVLLIIPRRRRFLPGDEDYDAGHPTMLS